jgi:hypothetical protein
MLGVPDDWLERLFPENNGVFYYQARYPNGDLQGVCGLSIPKSAYKTFSNARLHGAAATLYTDGKLETLASFATGNLDGPLKLWNENGQHLLYANYKHGKKDGIACFFRKGVPWLAEEWAIGQLQNEYLVKWVNKAARTITAVDMTGSEKTEYSKARGELNTLYAKIDVNKKALKNDLKKWCRKQDEEARKHSVSVLAPVRQARQSARLAAHAAENAATNESLWRTALRNSLPH